jgi:hypothetical protein
MALFDLLFLVSVVALAMMLVALAISILGGRRARVRKILNPFALYVAGYCALAVAVDFLKPQRIIAVGEPWCFDDWCLQVDSVTLASDGSRVRYMMRLRIFSTARGISQRAQGAWIYLMEKEGRLFPPETDSTNTPLTVRLAPEQSVNLSRNFEVPADAHILGLVTGHGGAFCGWGVLIIGEGGCLFNRPTMIRLQ